MGWHGGYNGVAWGIIKFYRYDPRMARTGCLEMLN